MILVPVILIIPYLGIEKEVCLGTLEASIGIPVTMLLMDFVFILASITDKLDGYLARSRNMVTTFGKFLDPLADKILVLTSLIILVQYDKLPAWVPAIILTREFLVSGYRLVAAQKGGEVIAASFLRKIKNSHTNACYYFSFCGYPWLWRVCFEWICDDETRIYCKYYKHNFDEFSCCGNDFFRI